MSFDFVKSLVKFLDPHLSLLLLEHFEEKKAFPQGQITLHKIAVLSKTSTFGYLEAEIAKLPQEVYSEEIQNLNKSIEAKKQEAAKTFYTYHHYAEPFLVRVIDDEKNYIELKSEKFSKAAYYRVFENIDFITKDVLEYAVKYARNFYDRGEYEEALKVLNTVVNLVEDEDVLINVYWGKVHSEFLISSYGEAHEDFKILRTKIDARALPSHSKMAQRVFLLHTALFFYLSEQSAESDYDALVELFTNEHYLSAIQVSAPHLIRYLGSALLLLKNNPKSKSNLHNLVPVFNKDISEYSDSLTEFIKILFGDFDFKKAQQKIKDFQKEFTNDYFLTKRTDQIINNSQTMFFEAFCRVYRKVNIKMVAEYLGVSQEEAEVWIVNLIRNANMEAKIDLEKGVLALTYSQPQIYEQVLTKTRDLIPRTTILVNNLQKILKGQQE